MTIETARAILNTSRLEAGRLSKTDDTDADQVAFDASMARLRPRRFLRTIVRAR
jgi:hypothetical protein